VIFEQVAVILVGQCQLKPDQPVFVGVSGGPDSQCLLDILFRLKYPLIIGYFNHRLRPEADGEALAVKHLAENRGLSFVSGEADVAAYARRDTLSLEEAARILRYKFLFNQAHKHHAQAVAVAHTADDQVETILMHFLRGSGLPGLRGMSYRSYISTWSESIPLVRPLLDVWKSEILIYCQENGLQPLQDLTNFDTSYYRNRLRQELIPYLESYNPAVRKAIWRTGKILSGDCQLIEGIVPQAWLVCVRKVGPGFMLFDYGSLIDQPDAMLRRIIRRAVMKLRPGLQEVDFDTVERAVAFLKSSKRTMQIDLLAGVTMQREYARLWIITSERELPSDDWPQIPTKKPILLTVPGEVELSAGWRLSAEYIDDVQSAFQQSIANEDPYLAWAAYDNLQLPLVVRARQPGERFQPLGMEETSVKLTDFMINIKMPSRLRLQWPLICGKRLDNAEESIVWVTGYRIGHSYRVTSHSQHVVLFRLVKP
jgi:tRNA(Ile)-lysidine synthase